jgi:hypothetical protein
MISVVESKVIIEFLDDMLELVRTQEQYRLYSEPILS